MDEKHTGITDVDARVILALAENNLKIKAVADTLHYSRNSIEYHVKKIRRVTGLNPQEFFDLSKLIQIAKTVLEGGWEWFNDKWRCSNCKTSLADMVGGYWDEPSAKPELKYCPECGKDMRGADNG